MRRLIGPAVLLVLLSGCADFKAKIDAGKKDKALNQCLEFAKKEARDPSQRTKIINQCMEASGYYGFDYAIQGK